MKHQADRARGETNHKASEAKHKVEPKVEDAKSGVSGAIESVKDTVGFQPLQQYCLSCQRMAVVGPGSCFVFSMRGPMSLDFLKKWDVACSLHVVDQSSLGSLFASATVSYPDIKISAKKGFHCQIMLVTSWCCYD